MFFLSICIAVVFILFIGFELGLEMFFTCLVLFFDIFWFIGFEIFYTYILMRNYFFLQNY